MKFEEWRKKEGISYWKLGKKMGINNVQNPSTKSSTLVFNL
jgi:hypothetical protein